MPDHDSKKIVSDISVLYELSLAAGQSLDLKVNCEHFLRTLMSRKNLEAASVWIWSGRLAGSDVAGQAGSGAGQSLVLVYGTPQFRVRETELPDTHPLWARLAAAGAYSLAHTQDGFTDIVTEKQIERGAFAVFPLGELGVLKLYSMTRHEPFPEEEINQLKNVVSKFTLSLEGCLAHEELRRDMAARRQAEEALRQSEEKYRSVVERATDGIVVLQDGKVAYANTSLARLAGRPVAEIIGKPFEQFIHPPELPKVRESYRLRMAGQAVPAVYETVLVAPDGKLLYAELNAGIIPYEGKPADLVFIRDISDRKTSDLERTRLAMAVVQTADAVIITDTAGTIQYVNPAFERITGYSRAEVIGKNPRLLKSGKQDPALYQNMWAALAQGEVWRGRFQDRRKDGSPFTCDAIITPTRDENGHVVNYVSVQRDVTRELQMEEQYLQAQKMESIGRLAGGIAHDFNNIMTAILGFGSMVLDQLGENHPLQHAVEQIVSAGERATNLTRQLLTFSRRQMTEVRILDLNAVVTEMYQLLRRALGEDVELITLLEENPASIKADAGLLQQVIMNLAINARDAMPRGGQLTIQTSRVILDERFCRPRVNVQPGDYVLLSVRDTGCGMTKEVLDHAFEPFFTTKPKGKGTGLGLATVYGIVRQCGGHIELESEPGSGTEVKVWLPRVPTPEEAVPVELEERPERGRETILVVEDEEIVRDLTVRLLKSLGYKVLEASNGKEALGLVEQYKSPIHLVLTDVVMPQMSGPELAERLQKIRPSARLLYTSGFTESAVFERGVTPGKVRLIQKPYSREILAQRVRETLDEG